MSGEVNMIQTLRKFRGGPDQANLGGASLETFSGGDQLRRTPCIDFINLFVLFGEKKRINSLSPMSTPNL